MAGARRDNPRRMHSEIACSRDQSRPMDAHDRLDRFGRGSCLRALSSGHKQTWDAFVVAAAPLVNAVVRRVLAADSDRGDAVSDAVQDTFARLCADDYRMLKSYDPVRANISTWLAVISWSSAAEQMVLMR